MIFAILAESGRKNARKAFEPPDLPLIPSRTSNLAGGAFFFGLVAILMVTTSAILKACTSMNEITEIPKPLHPAMELAAKIVLYASLLPAVGAAALGLAARGSIKESRGTLRGKSLYRSALVLSILSGVLAINGKILNPVSWLPAGAPGGAGGAGGMIFSSGDKSDPNRGYLGVEHEGAAGTDGIRLLRVLPGTPAERAGMKPGDRILRIDGVPLAPGESFADRIGALKPGTTVMLTLRRGDETIQATAVLTATFSSLLDLLEEAVNDEERLTVLETAGSERQFSSQELKKICETFVADPLRENAVVQVLPRVFDPQNAYQVLPTFISSSAKQSVSRKILEFTKSK